MSGSISGLLQELCARRFDRGSVEAPSAARHLPGEAIEDIAILADEHRASILIDRHDRHTGLLHPDRIVGTLGSTAQADGVDAHAEIWTIENRLSVQSAPGILLGHDVVPRPCLDASANCLSSLSTILDEARSKTAA